MEKSNYGIKVDLQKLQNAFLRNFTGKTAVKRCICIPIDDNPCLYLGEKGCYLDLVAIEQENPRYGDTHYVRGNIPKELYDKMTEEQRNSYPILGNMRPIGPKQQTVTGTVNMDAPEDEQQDDLPF